MPSRGILFMLAIVFAALLWRAESVPTSRPNFIVMLIDDMGYGDLEVYGHPTAQSPDITKFAEESTRFTNWLSGQSICTPSRSSMLTGRLPVRYGMAGHSWLGGVLLYDAVGGIPASETTFPEVLRENGYNTSCIGKWHVGQREEYLPTSKGFNHYFGIPYAHNEGWSAWNWKLGESEASQNALPLMRGTSVIEQPVDLSTITDRYTEEAITFMKENRDEPFFMYMAYNHVHIPLFCNDKYCDTSLRGEYGDSIAELDASVGRISAAVSQLGLEENTMIVLLSDNGPWLVEDLSGGSSGLFNEGKQSTWEGGFRVPAMAKWKGKIPENKVNHQMISTMDLFPTFLRLAGISAPEKLHLDGLDVSDMLVNGSATPHTHYLYYRGQTNFSNAEQPGLWAVRVGPYKVHYVTKCGYCPDEPVFHDPPLLFNVETDPSEKYPLNTTLYEGILQAAKEIVSAHEATLHDVPNMIIPTDEKYMVCCDHNSKEKYPEFPICTCNPDNFFLHPDYNVDL